MFRQRCSRLRDYSVIDSLIRGQLSDEAGWNTWLSGRCNRTSFFNDSGLNCWFSTSVDANIVSPCLIQLHWITYSAVAEAQKG